LAALAVAALSLATARPSQSESASTVLAAKDRAPLLAIAGERRNQKLMRLDSRSLRPLRGPTLDIFNGVSAWAFSPGRLHLALGTGCQAGVSLGTLELIDVRRLRSLGCFAIGKVGAAAWPTPNRLLVVAHSPLQVLLIDPKTERIVSRTPLEGRGLVGSARVGDRLVFLTGLFGEPQRLVVADLRGRVRSVGVEAPGAKDFVVDPSGRRAYIVSGATVADVDLGTLAVAYHELREQEYTRVLALFAPVAQAKEFHGETRRTLWVGGGLIASFGEDFVSDGRRFSSTPLGLRLIDTRTWTVRMVDEHVRFALLAGDVLLAAGDDGIGLVAYDLRGTKRFQLFRGRSLASLESYGGKAYVQVDGRGRQVVDVATGRAVGPRRAPLPTLLVER
jgi:hypothetical protein